MKRHPYLAKICRWIGDKAFRFKYGRCASCSWWNACKDECDAFEEIECKHRGEIK